MARLEDAFALHQKGDLAAAEKIYSEIINNEPNNLTALNAYGALLVQLERYDESEKIFNQAVELANKSAPQLLPALFNSRGNMQRRKGDLPAAIKDYQQSCDLNRNYTPAINNLAHAYLKSGNNKQAINCYQQAIALEPENPEFHINLAIALIKNQDNDLARSALNKALQISAHNLRAMLQLAELELAEGNYQAAKDFYYKYTESRPFDLGALTGLAQCMIETGEAKAAIDVSDNILEQDPKNLDAHYLLATAYVKLGDTGKALKEYYEQIEINPNMESYYNVGVILMNQNRFQEAIHYFIETLNYDQNNLGTHLNLASIYLKRQELEKARNHYYKAESLDPDNQEIKHILSSLTQEDIAKRAPDAYVENLFDQYSGHYDQHLQQHLKFKVPEIILSAVENTLSPKPDELSILDLGCGTGLCAEQLKQYTKSITGVDLSANMLAAAKAKNLYQELHQADILEYLSTDKNKYDLIIAGDVIPYLGDLSELFNALKQNIQPNGEFIFTMEAHNEDQDYTLQKTVRYAHSKKYIQQLAKKYNWRVVQIENAVLRQQLKQPINGYCVVLQPS